MLRRGSTRGFLPAGIDVSVRRKRAEPGRLAPTARARSTAESTVGVILGCAEPPASNLVRVRQHLAYRDGRGLHSPDAFIELVLSRRDHLHDLDGDGPSYRGPAFLVGGPPAPLRAPLPWPPRRPDRGQASTPRTHAGGSRTMPSELPLGGPTGPVVPQPGRTPADAHMPTPVASYGRNRARLVQEV